MSEIKYWTPVHNAWDKMVQVLFHPFDMGKWMVIGFCAFLANCGRDGGGGSGGSGHSGRSGEFGDVDFREVLSEVRFAAADAWAEHSGLILFGGIFLLVSIFLFSLLINFLNSRGQFMFLDNVIKNRGAVQAPWHEYRKESTSLMIFQMLFHWTGGMVVLTLIGGLVVPVFAMILQEQFIFPMFGVAVGAFGLLMVVSLVFGFVEMVLSHFVVPLMYQRRLSIPDGFRAFGPILKSHFWRIVLFGIVMILIDVAMGIVLMIGILLTCCTALLILIVPYIGTVVLLPVYVFKRFVGPEFIRQLGEEYDLLKDFPDGADDAA